MNILNRPVRIGVLIATLFMSILSFTGSAQAIPGEVYYTGTNTTLSGDDSSAGAFPIGFSFDFYGASYTTTHVNINGTLNFASGYADYTNQALPNAGPGPSVEAFWDDIITQGFNRQSIYYRTIGAAPNRKFITQWTNMYFYSDPSLPMGTFQAILYEGSNKVQVQYRDLLGGDPAKGSSATIGINKDGTTAQQVSHNTASLQQGQAISFTPNGGGSYIINTAADYELVYLADPLAPDPPALSMPVNNAPYQSTTPTLSWAAANQATSYRVLVATDADFTNIVANQAGIATTSYTLGTALNANTRYYWKVEAVNATASALSDTWNFKTTPPEDNDGITPASEDAAPNTGDANNDGTADSLQPTVASFVNPVNSNYASLAVAGCTGATGVSAAPASANATTDTGFTYPAGLLSATITCAAPGATATVTQYYYGLDPTGLTLRKYNPTTHTYQTIPGATITSVIIGGQQAAKVVYSITDGSALDEDGIVNGTIVDPAGLASVLAATTATTPAASSGPLAPNTGLAPVSQWPAGILAAFGLLCLLGLRRRPAL